MASRSSSTRQPPPPSSNVRRNLFNHLSRRPTTSSSTSATAMPETPPDESADIVVRDQNGKYQVQIPVLPALEDDQAPPAEGADAEAAKGKLEAARMIEMYRNRNLQSVDPAEMLSAVQESLRQKVAGLDADNWMFEREEEVKP